MKTRILCLWLLMLCATAYPQAASKAGAAHPKTVIKDNEAKARLLGEHRLSLQWISWDYFGKARVTESGGTLYLAGEQKARKGSDLLTIEGFITEVAATEFKFNGTIITRVEINNGGKPCERKGEMTFRITNNRRYWRLKEMESPCEDIVDYVDIFFR
ncbi:MAG TPA: hypothetical protein VF747_03020 [Blastocatellia bacterium]|jgi:hypothetical protein